MITKKELLLLVAVLTPVMGAAQQATTPTPRQPVVAPATPAKPCTSSTLANPAKHTHFHVPGKVAAIIQKQEAKLSAKAGIDLDANGAINEAINTPTPCAAGVTPRTEIK